MGVGLDLAGVVERELGQLVLDLADGDPRPVDADPAGVAIDLDVDVLFVGNAAIGGGDRLLHRPDQLLSGDLLLGIELEEGTDEISTHGRFRPPCRISAAKKNVGVTHVGAAIRFRH